MPTGFSGNLIVVAVKVTKGKIVLGSIVIIIALRGDSVFIFLSRFN